MRLLINIMIFSGSILMVYNIYRYGRFVKTSGELERQNRKGLLLVIPLVLLVFFLVGYLVIGFSGIANLMVAAILFGGSVFVFLLMWVMYSIIDRTRDTDRVLSLRYEEMKAELNAMAKDSLAIFLVNLTRDEVEERGGANLNESDYACDSYTELLSSRGKRAIDSDYSGSETGVFQREKLIKLYQEGQTYTSIVRLIRTKEGTASFVHIEATLTKMPVSGDIVACITERPYNDQVVRQRLVDNVLMEQYDRIAYLMDGNYHVIISNDGKKTGLLFPADTEDTYESIYFNYILPAQPKNRTKPEGPNPLRLSVIDKALERNVFYDVIAPFVIDGETRYKHFAFYRVDQRAKCYLMLLSDSTLVQEEQMRRNQQISDALAETVRSNQARIRFFTNVSHSLRTPMNGILGFTSMAKTENDPQKMKEYLEKVDYSGRRLQGLIDDLLAMSLIDSGSMHLSEAPTDLCAMAEELRERFAAERPEKTLHLQTDTGELRQNVVYCDSRRLRQLLSRLMENSCAFAPVGGSITLSITQGPSAEPDKETYEFRIRNIGIVIPEDILGRIFEPDAWTDSQKNDELPGVGIGMAVAKAFVDSMGGTAEVTSDADGETDFVVRIPLPPVQAEPDKQLVGTAEELDLHILLVDDNEINREIAELMLTAEGWTVIQAADGAEAVRKVAEADAGTFDIVLMDVQMPVMNGYEATAAIRALPDAEKAAIPVIAVTANAYQEDANGALAAGMNGYLSKPIDPAAIRSEIARVLGKRPRRGEHKGGEDK